MKQDCHTTEQGFAYETLTSACVRQTDPIEFVENICENMQLFPKQDFLTGDQLMFEYDPQVSSTTIRVLILIQDQSSEAALCRVCTLPVNHLCCQVISAALSLLTPNRANLLLLSPENEGCCLLREKWFGTCYSVEGMTLQPQQSDSVSPH